MALTKGVNVYVDDALAAADAYFAERSDSAAWTSAASAPKSVALVSGTSIIDLLNYSGSVVSDTQLMAFPRIGYYYDDRLGLVVEYSSSDAPDRAIKASYEMALHILANPNILLDKGRIDKLEVGPIKLEGLRRVSRIPVTVFHLLKPMLSSSANSLWRSG